MIDFNNLCCFERKGTESNSALRISYCIQTNAKKWRLALWPKFCSSLQQLDAWFASAELHFLSMIFADNAFVDEGDHRVLLDSAPSGEILQEKIEINPEKQKGRLDNFLM